MKTVTRKDESQSLKVTKAEPASVSRRPIGALLFTQTNIVWLIVLLSLPLSALINPNFPSWSLIESTLVLSLFLVLVAFGQGLTILSGGIDLSVPASVAVGAYLTGRLVSNGMPLVAAVVIALAVCAAVGVVNGIFVGKAGFPAFIVTLATSSIVAALLLGTSRGAPAQQAPEMVSTVFSRGTTVFGISSPIWILLLVCVLGWVIQHRTTLGRRIFAVGGSAEAARSAGVRVVRTYIFTYATAAVAYGLAGIALLGYSSAANLAIGQSWLLPSITAVVVGGSSIRGGAGTFMGTIAGAVLITLMGTYISSAGLSEGVQQVLYGVVIVVALIGAKIAGKRGAR